MSRNKIILIIIVAIFAVGSFFIIDLFSKNQDSNGNIEIIHELGTTKVKENPEKIVVFDFGILETLDKLKINVIGVPKESVPSHLSKYKEKDIVDVGTLFEPNFEVLYNLKPDLIIISGRQSDLYDELSKLAPTIYLPINQANFLASFKNNLDILSKIFTTTNNFTTEIEQIEEKINELTTHTLASNLKALVLMVNSSNISALGLGSRFDLIHNELKVKIADPNIAVSTHGQNVNFEYISNINPDIIFVMDRGIITEGVGTAENLLNNSLVNSTNAAINNKIIYLTPQNWYISTGGIDSFNVMIEDVFKAFID